MKLRESWSSLVLSFFPSPMAISDLTSPASQFSYKVMYISSASTELIGIFHIVEVCGYKVEHGFSSLCRSWFQFIKTFTGVWPSSIYGIRSLNISTHWKVVMRMFLKSLWVLQHMSSCSVMLSFDQIRVIELDRTLGKYVACFHVPILAEVCLEHIFCDGGKTCSAMNWPAFALGREKIDDKALCRCRLTSGRAQSFLV